MFVKCRRKRYSSSVSFVSSFVSFLTTDKSTWSEECRATMIPRMYSKSRCPIALCVLLPVSFLKSASMQPRSWRWPCRNSPCEPSLASTGCLPLPIFPWPPPPPTQASASRFRHGRSHSAKKCFNANARQWLDYEDGDVVPNNDIYTVSIGCPICSWTGLLWLGF